MVAGTSAFLAAEAFAQLADFSLGLGMPGHRGGV
jgi:hypothetical protein